MLFLYLCFSATILACDFLCTDLKNGLSQSYHPHTRFPRSSKWRTRDQHAKNTALYLNGADQLLKLRESKDANTVSASKREFFPRDRFTISFWLKPEGGQFDHAVMLELSDVCSEESENKRITIQMGISTNGNRERGAAFFGLLKTEMISATTTLWSVPYKANVWTHLALTYDSEIMKFYENGARVGVSRKQVGPLFSNLRSHCKQIFLGSSAITSTTDEDTNTKADKKSSFRGAIDDLSIWRKVLSQHEIIEFMRSPISDHADLIFVEKFENLLQWDVLGTKPKLIASDRSIDQHEIDIKISPCGQTICDDPGIILNYASNAELRKHKILKYRIVNIFDNDGTNPSVTSDQIRIQHEVLNRAFAPSNISWQLEIIDLHSTSLRRKTIIFGCDSTKIGNKQCNLECRHPITGNDGGDCDDHQNTRSCDERKMKGNRHCDMECNRPEYEWDWGECCNITNANDQKSICIDPKSHLRSYVGIDEYKRILNFTNEHALTVTFADWSNNELIGLSTFPWEKEVFSIYGGIILQPRRFGLVGHRENLVHEIGHALGLWHVHHGVSEMNCDDPCREIEASMSTGDLCMDTGPTPKNMDCKDPSTYFSKEKRSTMDHTCDLDSDFKNTPYRNYMSYSGEECTNHFTPHQTARMHCYIDLTYKTWRPKSDEKLSTIPVPARITHVSLNSLNLAWIPPLGFHACTPPGSISGHVSCTDQGRVIQYAYKAYSASQSKISGYWAPHQATGPPDSEPCEASTKSWLPDSSSCDEPSMCQLTLEFELAIIPESLSLWSSWNAADGIGQLLLHFTDGSLESVYPITLFCDIPFTASVNIGKKLKKIDIYTATPFISIDAMEIISAPDHELCKTCNRLSYRVHRYPPFDQASYKETQNRFFTDDEINAHESYEYRIQAMNGSKSITDFSSPLNYHADMSFCGNGKIEEYANFLKFKFSCRSNCSGEECDDANIQDNDGCTSVCKFENRFTCRGQPSRCYVYVDDGLCEDFEKLESVHDCGHYTPPEFIDQWPLKLITNAPESDSCNVSVLIGPAKHHTCGPKSDPKSTWRICTNYWRDPKAQIQLKAIFETPVIATSIFIHLASDGQFDLGNSENKNIRLELMGEDNRTHHVKGSESVSVTCKRKNGILEYPVWHELSRPYFYSRSVILNFESVSQHQLVLAGLRLRSRRALDPIVIKQCADNGILYNPILNQCMDNQCASVRCPDLRMEKNSPSQCVGNRNGDTCVVSCDHGYYASSDDRKSDEINRSVNIQCSNGHWNVKKIECKPIDCGTPKISHARVECMDGTTFGKRCTFYCLPPATVKGHENSMTCGQNGAWSMPESYCQLSCQAPIESNVHSKAINKLCRVHQKSLEAGSVNFPIGAKCKFICKTGYHVHGQSSNKRLFRRICSENGQWLGPNCVRVQCPEPKLVYAGIYNCTKGFDVGSECSFYCPGTNEIRMSVCVSDGKWTSSDPCDLPKGTCLAPPVVRDINFECKKKLYIGSSCKISCEATGYDPVLEHIVVTENNFKMQVLQKINHTTCSVQKTWEPDVRSLVCVKKCAQDFISDGWCDFQNNRGYCGWDGGDCCASTSKSGKVKFMFPSLCTSHLCHCLDPFAIENRNDLERAKLISSDFGLLSRSKIGCADIGHPADDHH